MDISRKTDYALRILAELMRHDNNNVLSVRTAAKRMMYPTHLRAPFSMT